MQPEQAAFILWGVKFSGYDVLLLILCPICGAFGAWVSSLMSRQKVMTEANLVQNVEEELKNIAQVVRAQAKIQGKDEVGQELLMDAKKEYEKQKRKKRWVLGTGFIIIGLALGIVVALYFMGAIGESVSAVTRVAGACILLGYQAPRLWVFQEKLLSEVVEEKIRSILQQNGDKSLEAAASNGK